MADDRLARLHSRVARAKTAGDIYRLHTDVAEEIAAAEARADRAVVAALEPLRDATMKLFTPLMAEGVGHDVPLRRLVPVLRRRVGRALWWRQRGCLARGCAVRHEDLAYALMRLLRMARVPVNLNGVKPVAPPPEELRRIRFVAYALEHEKFDAAFWGYRQNAAERSRAAARAREVANFAEAAIAISAASHCAEAGRGRGLTRSRERRQPHGRRRRTATSRDDGSSGPEEPSARPRVARYAYACLAPGSRS
jgi:hypothetical protein